MFFIIFFTIFFPSYIASQCATYGVCSKPDERMVFCETNQVPNTSNFSNANVANICEYTTSEPICCDQDQLVHLKRTIKTVIREQFGYSSKCYSNIVKLLCLITCDPNQSKFVTTDNIYMNDNSAINVIIYVSETKGIDLYESCKYAGFNNSLFNMEYEQCDDISQNLSMFFHSLLRIYPMGKYLTSVRFTKNNIELMNSKFVVNHSYVQATSTVLIICFCFLILWYIIYTYSAFIIYNNKT